MIEKIKDLFKMLPRGEQLELIRELNSIVKDENPITEVNLRSQSRFGENITFKISTQTENKVITVIAELFSPWGTFTAEGSNQKIAKTKAAEKALVVLKSKMEDERKSD